MTTLAEMTQIVARTVSKVHDGVSTGGSTSTLIDTSLVARIGHYNAGTIWVTQSGVVSSRRISTYDSSNTLTFAPVLTTAVVAGILYSVAPATFPKDELEQAVKESLLKLAVLKVDNTMSVAEGAAVTLPAGVSDVRQVLIDGVTCYHWYEVNGTIRFDKTSYTGDLEVRYAGVPAMPTTDASIIDPAVGVEWLHWACVSKLWRDYYRDNLKDNPVAIELFNEARQNEINALNSMHTLGRLAPARDPHHSNW